LHIVVLCYKKCQKMANDRCTADVTHDDTKPVRLFYFSNSLIDVFEMFMVVLMFNTLIII